MVKGNESLVVCSYTWLRETPQPAEISRVRGIGRLFSAHGASMYASLLDPRLNSYENHAEVIQRTIDAMSPSGIWLAIVANTRKADLLEAQAAIAVSRGMQIVLGCQDEFVDSVPHIEPYAAATGRVFYWETDADLRDSIEDVVVPMCDNIKNDFNTVWINQRKAG